MELEQDLRSAAARLRSARTLAGHPSAAAAARTFGWGEAAYRHHENGTRSFDVNQAQTYASAFNVPVSWLLGINVRNDTFRVPVGRFYMELYARELGGDATIYKLADDVFINTGQVLLPELRVSDNEFAWIKGVDGIPPFHFVDPSNLKVDPAIVSEGFVFAYRVHKRHPKAHMDYGDVVFVDTSTHDVGTKPELWLMRDELGPLITWAQLMSSGDILLMPNQSGETATNSADLDRFDVVGRVVWHGRPV